WRTGRHLPRQRGGIFGWSRIADQESRRFDEERPLAVLLLPVELEQFALRDRGADQRRGRRQPRGRAGQAAAAARLPARGGRLPPGRVPAGAVAPRPAPRRRALVRAV